MLSYCLESENCLRKALVGGVGGDVTKLNCPCSLCCTSCSGGTVPYVPIDILKPLRSQRSKRPPLVRDVAEEVVQRLEQQLKEARKKIVASSTSLGILGCQFVCPDPVIRQICSNVNSIKTATDLSVFFLRPEYRDRFFTTLSEIVKDAPPPTRRRRAK